VPAKIDELVQVLEEQQVERRLKRYANALHCLGPLLLGHQVRGILGRRSMLHM